MGKLRDRLSAWADNEDQDRRDLREAFEAKDVFAISEAPNRQPVQLRGSLRTVTLRPRGGVPALEAELFDGTGVVTVVWLGRRRIAGISPGRSIQVAGRIGLQDDARVLCNPRYELIP